MRAPNTGAAPGTLTGVGLTKDVGTVVRGSEGSFGTGGGVDGGGPAVDCGTCVLDSVADGGGGEGGASDLTSFVACTDSAFFEGALAKLKFEIKSSKYFEIHTHKHQYK